LKCLINRNILCPITTLLPDFGLNGSYVAEMKTAILSLSREVQIIDISHQVEKFDVRTGAFLLACAAPYFPEDTIPVAVVDPGVGTVSPPIIIQTRNACYVGPDNGVLALAARNDDGPRSVHKINDRKLMLPNVSSTFHGRDVFAPAAARLANGTRPANSDPKSARSMPHIRTGHPEARDTGRRGNPHRRFRQHNNKLPAERHPTCKNRTCIQSKNQKH